MKEIFFNVINSPNVILLAIIYLIISCITTYDIRITQAKRNGILSVEEPDLPKWISLLFWIEWITLIIISILDWKFAIILFVLKFILKVLPVLETIGKILVQPFRK